MKCYFILLILLALTSCTNIYTRNIEVPEESKAVCLRDNMECPLEACENICCSKTYYEDYLDHKPCECEEGWECQCAGATYCGAKQ